MKPHSPWTKALAAMTHTGKKGIDMTELSPLVWVVDDEEVNRILARAYLERIGWSVREFSNGNDVMRALQGEKPHAILLDIRMPGILGDELIVKIRASTPISEVRIVGYTAHCIEETVQHILAAGFDQLLIKPVSYQQMTDALPLPLEFRD